MAGARQKRAAQADPDPTPEPTRRVSAVMAPPAWLQGHWGGVPDPEAESACRVGVLEVSRSGGKSAGSAPAIAGRNIRSIGANC